MIKHILAGGAAVLFGMLLALALGCAHSPDPVPTSAGAPPCLNLGPGGDAEPWYGQCPPNLSDGDGNSCVPCFYDEGCIAGENHCVDGRFGCADPACSLDVKLRKARNK